ncbi:unnamed protein product [Lathyrus oleraceus]
MTNNLERRTLPVFIPNRLFLFLLNRNCPNNTSSCHGSKGNQGDRSRMSKVFNHVCFSNNRQVISSSQCSFQQS